jgi:putative FmdB family regulatory protein
MTYEYTCKSCGHTWEVEQKISDLPLKKCTNCGEETAQRLISTGAGFLLKGGGWAKDLYDKPAKNPNS